MNHLASPEPEGKLTRPGDRGVGGDGGGVAGRGGGREGGKSFERRDIIERDLLGREERRDFDEDGMDGDASVACLFSSPLLVSIFLLPVDRGREENPFVTFWGKRVREKWVCGRGGGTIRDFNAFGPDSEGSSCRLELHLLHTGFCVNLKHTCI